MLAFPRADDPRARHPSRAGDPVSFLRAQVEALSEGLSPSVLALAPTDLRVLAARAIEARDRAARRRARVGDRPAIDDDAATAALDASRAVLEDRRSAAQRRTARQRRLAAANGIGLAALAGAGTLLSLGATPFSPPVAAAVVTAGSAPLVVAVFAASTAARARRRAKAASARFAVALEASGFETLGQLSARRLACEAWRRRTIEAEHAEQAARAASAAWSAVAGAETPPDDVDRVLARVRLLRAVQLRLLQVLLEQHTRRRTTGLSASTATQGDERATDLAPAEDGRPDDAWLDGALDRIRGRRIHALG